MARTGKQGMRVVPGVALGAMITIGCFSPGQGLAQLHLTVSGQGCVHVARHLADPACDGGICDGGGCNPGSGGMAYEADTDVTFTSATPDAGWHFDSWQITTYTAAHTFVTFTSTDVPLVVHNTGVQMDVVATFCPTACETGCCDQ